MYADKVTEAIKGALDETDRRRAIQLAYNEEHGITPESIVKGVSDIAEFLSLESPTVPTRRRRGGSKVEGMSAEELEKLVVTLEEEMFAAAEELRFEYAAKLRDEIKELRRELLARGRERLPDPRRRRTRDMCRNIRTLHNFEPPATEDEVRAAALQYVRKISGYDQPVEGERGGLRARRRRGRRRLDAAARRADDDRARRATARSRRRRRARAEPALRHGPASA